MTVCNMSIEGGARAGLVAPDDTTFAYLRGPPRARQGDFDAAVERWRAYAHATTTPRSTARSWSTRRRWRRRSRGAPTRARRRRSRARPACPSRRRADEERALAYMGARGRHAARGHRDRPRVHRLLHQQPPGGPARRRAGRARASASPTACGRWSCRAPCRSRRPPRPRGSTASSPPAGFEWRNAGCSMCLGMNPDILAAGERCASTSNRNFEGRQGVGGRTHLVSPEMAAAAAIAGHLVDVRSWS